MAKLKVKNFGPIKEGLIDGDGYIDTQKVTVFIGNQGSGKSTVAKLISTFSWLEKVIMKREFNLLEEFFGFKELQKYFRYQNISDYFVFDDKGSVISELYYRGENVDISLKETVVSYEIRGVIEYKTPKIMYVPSERNFISAVENFRDLKGLSDMIYLFAAEFDKALKEKDDYTLPINDVLYHYDNSNKTSYISKGSSYQIKLSEASSGYQSLVPLYVVSKYLTNLVKNVREKGKLYSNNRSITEKENIQKVRDKLKKELDDVQKQTFDFLNINANQVDNVKDLVLSPEENILLQDGLLRGNKLLHELIEIEKVLIDDELGYLAYHSFLNIVEEPEQNLYPSSQRIMLNSLLALNNELIENRLIITTHSPYLINYLTLAVKGKTVLDKIGDNQEKKDKFHKIVPKESVISGEDLVIYQLDEKDGTIRKLDTYKGMPSDENWLNEQLGEFNDDYATLLEIEKF